MGPFICICGSVLWLVEVFCITGRVLWFVEVFCISGSVLWFVEVFCISGSVLSLWATVDWVLSLVLVKKPNGKLRVCIDPQPLENDFQGALKHLTSSFVSFTEERCSEHQLKIAWYKISCCHKVIVTWCSRGQRPWILDERFSQSKQSLCWPQPFFWNRNVSKPISLWA